MHRLVLGPSVRRCVLVAAAMSLGGLTPAWADLSYSLDSVPDAIGNHLASSFWLLAQKNPVSGLLVFPGSDTVQRRRFLTAGYSSPYGGWGSGQYYYSQQFGRADGDRIGAYVGGRTLSGNENERPTQSSGSDELLTSGSSSDLVSAGLWYQTQGHQVLRGIAAYGEYRQYLMSSKDHVASTSADVQTDRLDSTDQRSGWMRVNAVLKLPGRGHSLRLGFRVAWTDQISYSSDIEKNSGQTAGETYSQKHTGSTSYSWSAGYLFVPASHEVAFSVLAGRLTGSQASESAGGATKPAVIDLRGRFDWQPREFGMDYRDDGLTVDALLSVKRSIAPVDFYAGFEARGLVGDLNQLQDGKPVSSGSATVAYKRLDLELPLRAECAVSRGFSLFCQWTPQYTMSSHHAVPGLYATSQSATCMSLRRGLVGCEWHPIDRVSITVAPWVGASIYLAQLEVRWRF